LLPLELETLNPKPLELQVRQGFASRRKMLRNTLQALYSSEAVAGALDASGLNRDSRAQDLLVEDFVRLHWALEGVAGAAAEGLAATEWEGHATVEGLGAE
jgi:16S rRNA (adenine1518-N6/adenine1519-N6)-dimethyltransferase